MPIVVITLGVDKVVWRLNTDVMGGEPLEITENRPHGDPPQRPGPTSKRTAHH